MAEDDIENVSPELVAEWETRVMGASVRRANSASLAWPYAADAKNSADFQVRRAIVQASGGARFTIAEPIFGEADQEYSLLMLGAANRVKVSAEKALAQLVAEAKTAGATWQDIGNVLGIGKTAAQKRFGAALPTEDEIQVEILRGAMARSAIAGWSGMLVAPEEEEGDPSPAYMLYFAFQRLLRMLARLEDFGAKVLDVVEQYGLDYRKGLDIAMSEELISIYGSLRDACQLLVRQDVMASAQITVDDFRGGSADMSVNVYLCKATIDALIARRYLEIAMEHFFRDFDVFGGSLMSASESMESCAKILFLPQCQHFLNAIKRELMDKGEWVDVERETVDDQGVVAERSEKWWRAYYRNDEVTLREMAEEFNLLRKRGRKAPS